MSKIRNTYILMSILELMIEEVKGFKITCDKCKYSWLCRRGEQLPAVCSNRKCKTKNYNKDELK